MQYLGRIDDAKGVFESVIKEGSDYPLVTDPAHKSLDFLNDLGSRMKRVETLREHWRSEENNLLSQHKESIDQYLHKLGEVINSQTFTAAKDIKQQIDTLLLRIKFISLKQDAPREVVSAKEFEDLPTLYEQMIEGIDKSAVQKYETAIEEIDYTINTIGE